MEGRRDTAVGSGTPEGQGKYKKKNCVDGKKKKKKLKYILYVVITDPGNEIM